MRLSDMCGDLGDKLVLENLTWVHDTMVRDLKQAKSKKKPPPCIFSMDRKEDIEIMTQHIAAFEIVMRYYGWTK
jgi:hypothetical protein